MSKVPIFAHCPKKKKFLKDNHFSDYFLLVHKFAWQENITFHIRLLCSFLMSQFKNNSHTEQISFISLKP